MLRDSTARLDRIFSGRSGMQTSAISACGVLVVGCVDYLTGYEISISVFYIGPVVVAAWYAGGLAGPGISLLACISWFVADAVVGKPLEHPIIETWNTLVRLSYFLVISVLATTLRKHLRNERQLARTDPLTGLFGRRSFEERLEHDLALARRLQCPVTIAYLDLDNFKSLNDTFGHAEGDRVLRAIGRALGENRRRGDTVARLGGDEFALVLPNTDKPGAEKFIAELRERLRKAFVRSSWRFSCSVGAVTFHSAPPSLEEALSAADALMYVAKGQGKDAVVFKVVGRAQRGAVQPRAAADAPEGARR
jgi:diguanylate cyclase (GGDEF)-like protein